MAVGAQETAQQQKVVLSGSIQSDLLVPQEDNEIGTGRYDDKVLANTYAELQLQSRYIDAGARFEYLDHPLPGFESDFAGWGVPHFYVKGHLRNVEVMLGDCYEQFGSGFILRTYEERSLGIDNALRGARVVYKPASGITLKALSGRQRRYWNHNHAWVSGAEVELGVEQWIPRLREADAYLTLSASFVNKNEDDEDIMVDGTHRLNLPRNVNAFDVQARFQQGCWSLLAEYAQKTQDPSYDNGYIYRRGYVAMLSASYSKRGVSALLQAKRSDNMSSRSRRSMAGVSSFVNHLPAFTMEHTYALAALYPYATHPQGEWAYQAELGYTFRRHTLLGGRYGTNVKLNFSHVHAISRNEHDAATRDGYGSAFWRWGSERYYQDLNVQVDKKLSPAFKLHLMYMNQFYNKTAVEGEGGMIHSNIFVAEGKYRISRRVALRAEAQYLTTGEDDGDWAYALCELSLHPHWMLTLSDMYNCGATDTHYYQGLLTFSSGGHRLQAGYVRTRSGYNCSGGVCRWVPASKGVSISYSYNF
ncbi:MAG: hypothetical protein IJ710_07130 [Prevotella sp.]|nr:hypothetical protein [Prevotella sp.]